MRIVITGPNGFIASNIILKLNKKNEIILLSNKKPKFQFLKKFKMIKFDLKKNIIPNIDCDILIHAAAITPQKKYSFKEFEKINFKSLKEIVKNIKIKKKIIFFSTSDIYKNQEKHFMLKENMHINIKKLSAYAKSKYKCEDYLKKLDPKKFSFEKIILRLPGIVGENNHKNFISNITNNILNNRKFTIFGGENYFNNIFHIHSLTKFVNELIEIKIKKNFEIINLCAKNPMKIKNILLLLGSKITPTKLKLSKKNMFTMNADKLNKYFKYNLNTKKILTKYKKEIISKNK